MSLIPSAPVFDTEERVESAQQRFHRLYITSTEIAEMLGVNRTSVLYGHRNKKLPEPITVNSNQLYIWERAEAMPYITRWKLALDHRRGTTIEDNV